MKNILYLLGMLLLFNACIKNNPDPSWLEVGEWQLEANPALSLTEGVLTHNISDAWVYVDNELIGVFEVPFKVPVLKEGAKELKIYPTIKNNGISATKKIYPFLEVYTVNINLAQNEVTSVSPVTRYKNASKFYIEDFDDVADVFNEGNGSLAVLQHTSDPSVFDPAINGDAFARVSLNTADYKWVASTTINNGTLNMPLPKGQEVYLEIDYHITNELLTGVLAIQSGGLTDNPFIQINAQPAPIEWKKIYLDLREIVSGSVNADYFEFSFNAELDEGLTSGEINIDNVKAVYF